MTFKNKISYALILMSIILFYYVAYQVKFNNGILPYHCGTFNGKVVKIPKSFHVPGYLNKPSYPSTDTSNCLSQIRGFQVATDFFGNPSPKESYFAPKNVIIYISRNDDISLFAEALQNQSDNGSLRLKTGKFDTYDTFQGAWETFSYKQENGVIVSSIICPLNETEKKNWSAWKKNSSLPEKSQRLRDLDKQYEYMAKRIESLNLINSNDLPDDADENYNEDCTYSFIEGNNKLLIIPNQIMGLGPEDIKMFSIGVMKKLGFILST